MVSFCELCNKNAVSYKFLINWSSSKKLRIFLNRKKKSQYLEISNRILLKSQNSRSYHGCFCELPRNLHVFNFLVEILNFQTALMVRFQTGWDFIWQRGSAADRNFQKLNRNIGRKSRVFVAFWIGIRKYFLLGRNKTFQEQKTKNANRNLFRI